MASFPLSSAAGIRDVLKLLPLARSYQVRPLTPCSLVPADVVEPCLVAQTIDELGDDTFNWQCYFVTHLVYVFSDWGQVIFDYLRHGC